MCMFVSCSLKNPRVEEIVRNVNIHHHTKTCRKYSNTSCRFNFPRFPSLKTIVSIPLRLLKLSPDQKKKIISDNDKLLSKVKKILEDDDAMEELRNICSHDGLHLLALFC